MLIFPMWPCSDAGIYPRSAPVLLRGVGTLWSRVVLSPTCPISLPFVHVAHPGIIREQRVFCRYIRPLAAFQIGDKLIEARVVSQRFQIVVGSNELSIIVASFNGAVQIVEGFIAAARCCGSAGEVVPQPEHIPVVNRALIAAYSGYGVEVELFSILVASGSNQRGTEDPKRFHRVVVQGPESSQLIVEGRPSEDHRFLRFLLFEQDVCEERSGRQRIRVMRVQHTRLSFQSLVESVSQLRGICFRA